MNNKTKCDKEEFCIENRELCSECAYRHFDFEEKNRMLNDGVRCEAFDADLIIIKPKKERKKVVHLNLKKKKRKKGQKSKRDYVDGSRLYTIMVAWHHINRKIIKLEKRILHPSISENLFEILGEKLAILRYGKKKIFDEMCINYLKMAKRFTNHKNFRGLSADVKEELAFDSLIKGMGTGSNENNINYGIPYMCRFDIKRSESVFSHWDQTIQNFFYQWTNENKKQDGIKQEVLHSRLRQLQQDAFDVGCKGQLNFLADIKEEDEKS